MQEITEEVVVDEVETLLAPDFEEALAELGNGDLDALQDIEGEVLAELAAPLEEEAILKFSIDIHSLEGPLQHPYQTRVLACRLTRPKMIPVLQLTSLMRHGVIFIFWEGNGFQCCCQEEIVVDDAQDDIDLLPEEAVMQFMHAMLLSMRLYLCQ